MISGLRIIRWFLKKEIKKGNGQNKLTGKKPKTPCKNQNPNEWGERAMDRIKNFFKDESGASAVEYGLLVALIAAVIITSVTTLGNNINTKFASVKNAIGS